MRITENRPERLGFEARPLVMSVLLGLGTLLMLALTITLFSPTERDSWVFPGGLAIVGAAFAGATRRTELVFDRDAGEARLRHKSIFGPNLRKMPLGDIVSVSARQDPGVGGRKGIRTYSLWLEMNDEADVQLTRHGSSGDGPAGIADAMNAWLAAARPHR